jgi:hypothetical protein
MSSSESSFDLYMHEFRDLIRQIEKRLHTEDNNESSSSSSSSPSSSISDLLDQCQELIPQMELEIRGTSDRSIKQERKDILQACKLQLVSYKALEKTTTQSTTNTGSYCLWDETTERNYRRETMELQDQVGRQNTVLDDALRSIRETEQVGAEITAELERNRTTLESAHANVHSLSSMTEQANDLLKSMTKKWWIPSPRRN